MQNLEASGPYISAASDVLDYACCSAINICRPLICKLQVLAWLSWSARAFTEMVNKINQKIDFSVWARRPSGRRILSAVSRRNARSNLLLHEFDRLQTKAYSEPPEDFSSTCTYLALSAPCGYRLCSAASARISASRRSHSPKHVRAGVLRSTDNETDAHRAGHQETTDMYPSRGVPLYSVWPLNLLNNIVELGYRMPRIVWKPYEQLM